MVFLRDAVGFEGLYDVGVYSCREEGGGFWALFTEELFNVCGGGEDGVVRFDGGLDI